MSKKDFEYDVKPFFYFSIFIFFFLETPNVIFSIYSKINYNLIILLKEMFTVAKKVDFSQIIILI